MSEYETKRDQYIHDHALDVTLSLHYVFEAAENRIAALEADKKAAREDAEYQRLRSEQAEAELEQARLARGQDARDFFNVNSSRIKAEAERDEAKQLLRGATAINRSLKASEVSAERERDALDAMLRLAFEQEEMPIAWQPEKYEAWLADLRYPAPMSA